MTLCAIPLIELYGFMAQTEELDIDTQSPRCSGDKSAHVRSSIPGGGSSG